MKEIALKPIDGKATEIIQSAIDEAYLSGGGKVTLETGLYLVGGIRLRSNVHLHLSKNTVLKGTREPNDYFAWKDDKIQPVKEEDITDKIWVGYASEDFDFVTKPGSSWNNGIIRILDSENVSLTGEEGSVIDGSDCYDERGEEKFRGPHAISVWNSKNLYFDGYEVRDSANWAHAVFKSKELTFKNITCSAGHDGIHLTACDDIKIDNCEFYTGDDCVAGFDNDGVTVTNCVMNTACNGMRFGGNDVLVENCRFYGPCKHYFRGSLSLEEKIAGAHASTIGRKNMLSSITYYCDYTFILRREPKNFVVRNCTFDNIDRFLHLNFSGNERWQKQCPLREIVFENIKASRIGMSLCAYSTVDKPVTLTLKNFDIDFREEQTELIRTHAYNKITLDRVTVKNGGETLVRSWGADGEIEVSEVKSTAKETLIKENGPFVTSRI